MEQTEEYVNGQLKNKYGDAFIRGNNGTLIFEMQWYYKHAHTDSHIYMENWDIVYYSQ